MSNRGVVLKIAGCMTVALSLSSCQPPPPSILAVLESGRIVFHIRDRALLTDRVFGWNDSDHSVEGPTVALGTAQYWRVGEALPGNSPCSDRKTFPIAYGEARCGYRPSQTAKNLLPGGPYRVKLEGARDYWSGQVLGAFLVRGDGSPDNVRPEQAAQNK